MTARGNIESVMARLVPMVGDRATQASHVLQGHGRSEVYHPSQPPDIVVFPQSTAEVQQIVRLCAQHRVPVIPFGVGSSLEGHVNAIKGGITAG